MAKTPLPLPQPKQAIEISLATLDDVPWIDDLAKRHRNGLGFQTLGAIEGKIALGQIIVAWSRRNSELGTMNDEIGEEASSFNVHRSPFRVPLGYCMATDRYMKHEDVGIIYQMNVEPGAQRGFVGAALLKAQFERSAYGCKLYCCWCAQDLAANRFWEAMGFVPIAYRGGSVKRSRVHIFWQKRIREGDQTTPWWYPSQTQGGAMSDRLVFPIPPGTHWSEVKAVILPKDELPVASGQLPEKSRRAKSSLATSNRPLATPPAKRLPLSGGMCFAPAVVETTPAPIEGAAVKKIREKKARLKTKNDPKLVAAARELKDRWLERLNDGTMLIESAGKYDVVRALPALSAVDGPARGLGSIGPVKLLAAA